MSYSFQIKICYPHVTLAYEYIIGPSECFQAPSIKKPSVKKLLLILFFLKGELLNGHIAQKTLFPAKVAPHNGR